MTSPSEAATELPAAEASSIPVEIESRWPPALALLAFMTLNVAIRLWLPDEGAVRLHWLVPSIELVLLVDSYGLLSLAFDRESAAATLRVKAGSGVTLVPEGPA